jgi:hypothetical protein
MITHRKFWKVAAVIATVGLATSSAVTSMLSIPGGARAQAAWAFTTRDVNGLVRYADAIVVADVVETYPGRVATSENGEDNLPFQIVELRVRDAIKGSFSDGRAFLERAGGIDPVEQVSVHIDADGGEFERGESYLLFLKAQDGDTGMYYQINDQARYALVGDRLSALEPEEDPVQQVFHRRTVAEASALIRRLLE